MRLDAFVDIFSWNLQMKAVIEVFERQGDQLLMFLLEFELHICLNVISVSILYVSLLFSSSYYFQKVSCFFPKLECLTAIKSLFCSLLNIISEYSYF